MKIVQPSFSIIEQEPGIDGVYKQIEMAGRTCYKSEDRITETSAKSFVERMIASQHTAMLEHGTVYLYAPTESYINSEGDVVYDNPLSKYEDNAFSWAEEDINEEGVEGFYVTSNYRVLIENNWLRDLQYFCNPTTHHHKRVTVLFHTQVAISRELNRHRVNSMAESSTRYCNYSKDKFGNEVTINLPSWIDEHEAVKQQIQNGDVCNQIVRLSHLWDDFPEKFPTSFTALDYWVLANLVAEYCYMGLIQSGWTAQQARTILPLDTHTDLVHTAFISDWKHFFDLRATGTTGKPHPDASCLAIPLYQEFQKDIYYESIKAKWSDSRF